MAVIETIKIQLKLISNSFINPLGRANKKLNDFNRDVRNTSNGMLGAARSSNILQKNLSGGAAAMRAPVERMKELRTKQGGWNKRMRESNTMLGRTILGLRNATHGMRGFRMEMLGVMFFGMSMQRLFTGLLRPSLEMVGVFDVLSAALGLLFLPLALKVLDWSIKFLKFVTRMTPKQKKWANMFVVVGVVVGTLLMLFGTLVLGLGSLALAFGFLFSPIGVVITALTTLVGFSFLNSMFRDTGDAIQYAETKMLAFGVSADSLETIKEKITELLSTMSTMKEEWSIIGANIAGGLVDGIVKYFKDNPLTIVGAIAGGLLGGPAGVAMGAAIGTLFKNLKLDQISELVNSGLKILTEIISGIKKNMGKLEEVVKDIAEQLTKFITDHIGDFIEIGFKIGVAIVKGILNGIGSFGQKIADKIESNRNPGSGSDSSSVPHFNDFIWRPGQGAVSINPNDTLVGFKGAPPSLGTSEGANITNNFYGFTMEDLSRELDDRDRNLVSQMEAGR